MSRETDTRGGGSFGWRLAVVALAAVGVVSALAVAPATTVAQSSSNGTDATFIVEQGSTCTQLTPLGDGTKTVADFYDYEVLNDTANYSSLGTTDIQLANTSQVFVYDGSDGLSLVFLNDKVGQTGGYVATADISGLPENGEWAVEDDNYTGRDDSFRYNATGAHIMWYGNGGRTDGAAFRGLESPKYSTISVDIAFNQRAEQYPFEEWTGPPEANRITQWVARSGNGETTQLDMNRSIQLSPGTCSGGVSTFTPTTAATTNGTTGPSNGTTAATTLPTGTASTRTQTATPTAMATETPTATATRTAPATGTTVPTAPNGSAGTTESGSGGGDRNGGDSGAFGPGFGLVVALVAVVLAAAALARRNR